MYKTIIHGSYLALFLNWHRLSMEGSLFLLLALACLLVYVYQYLKTRRFNTLAARLPGPPPLPLIGNVLDFFGDSAETFDRLVVYTKKYGGIIRLWLGPRLLVIVTEPKDIEAILGNPRIRNREPVICEVMQNISGPSILTTRDENWKSRRRLITPLFHFRILESYVEVFGRKASILVDRLEEVADGRTFDVYEQLSLTTLDSICETVIGINMNTQVNGESAFGAAIHRSFELVHERIVRPWMLVSALYALTANSAKAAALKKELHSFTSKIINNKLAEYQAGKKETERFMTVGGTKKIIPFSDLLIASSEEDTETVLTKEELADEVMTVAGSGLETTATTMSCALLMVAMHPEVQKAVVAELREVFDGDDRAATAQDIANMQTLRRVLKETLRVFPPVTASPREISEDVTLSSGLVLPKGSGVLIIAHIAHRMEAYWKNANAFVPDRWLPENNTEKRNPFAYIPFSAGPRNCVGQKYAMLQMVSVLSSVLRRFEVSTSTKMEELDRITLSLASRPVVGYKIQMKRRVWTDCGLADDRNNNARG